ncbi:MAG: acyl-CoA thioesterase [Cellvibrionaceae bacterium]
MSTDFDDDIPEPTGELTLQTLAMPADTNPNGDIFGGWLLAQMDLAGAMMARRLTKGRITTVAVGDMTFLRPIPVGSIVSCYCDIVESGRTSVRVLVDVWISLADNPEKIKVTEGEFVFVAIDDKGNTRSFDAS